MKYLVTGANGFLGSHLVRRLVNRGCDVVAMVRPTSNLRRLEGLTSKIEYRFAALDSRESVLKVIEDIDCIFHLAANVRIGSFRRKQLMSVNVNGTVNVFEAAKEAGIPKVVYVSSISIFGSEIEKIVDEKDVERGKIMSSYGESKVKSYYSYKTAYNAGLPVTCVIPSNIFGPDDPNFGPLLKNYVQKHLKIIAGNLKANMGMVYVDDVAEALILASEKGEIGESYILNDVNLTLGELLAKMEQVTGIKSPKFKIPKTVVSSAALLSEIAGRIIRHNLLLNRQSAKLLYTTHPVFDSSKAKKKLGWKPSPFDDCFQKTLNWYLGKYVRKH